MGLMCIENTNYFINIGFSIRPYYIGIILLLILIGNPINHKRVKSILGCYSLLLILGIIGLFFTPNTHKQNEYANSLIIFAFQVLTYYVLVNSFCKCSKVTFFCTLKFIYRCVAVISLIIYCISFSSMLGVIGGKAPGVFTGHDGIPRLVGLFADPNYFSLYMLILTGILMYLKLNNVIRFNKYDLLAICIGLLNIILSMSRSALGTILIFGILLLIYRPQKKFFLYTILTISTICIFLFSTENPIIEIALERFDETGQDGSSMERLFLLSKGLEAPTYYPLGVGVGQCGNYYLNYFNIPKLAHNDFITVLIECGVIGLLTYIFIWLQVYIGVNIIGKIIILCIMIMSCTLTCYAYEPSIPLALAFYTFFNRNEIKNLSNQ